MKEQNIIVHVMMDDGKQLTFERFTQKTVKGVLSQYKKLVGDIFADLFF